MCKGRREKLSEDGPVQTPLLGTAPSCTRSLPSLLLSRYSGPCNGTAPCGTITGPGLPRSGAGLWLSWCPREPAALVCCVLPKTDTGKETRAARERPQKRNQIITSKRDRAHQIQSSTQSFLRKWEKYIRLFAGY